MALVKRYDSKDKIPAGQEAFYVEHEGAWVLNKAIQEDRDELASKVSEFRENNTKALKELEAERKAKAEADARLKEFEGIDPAKVKEDQEKARLAEEAGLKAKGDLDTLKKRWKDEADAEAAKKLAAKETELKAEKAKIAEAQAEITKRDAILANLLVNQEIQRVVTEKGARAEALEDIVARATIPAAGRVVWKLVNDKPAAFKDGAEATNPATGQAYTISEWADELAKSATHLFQENRGSGAGSGASGGGGNRHTGKNPYAKGSINLTQQVKLEKENPTLAKALQAQAAV